MNLVTEGKLALTRRYFSPLLLIHLLPRQLIHDMCLWVCVCEYLRLSFICTDKKPLCPPHPTHIFRIDCSTVIYFRSGSMNQFPMEIQRFSFENSWSVFSGRPQIHSPDWLTFDITQAISLYFMRNNLSCFLRWSLLIFVLFECQLILCVSISTLVRILIFPSYLHPNLRATVNVLPSPWPKPCSTLNLKAKT